LVIPPVAWSGVEMVTPSGDVFATEIIPSPKSNPRKSKPPSVIGAVPVNSTAPPSTLSVVPACPSTAIGAAPEFCTSSELTRLPARPLAAAVTFAFSVGCAASYAANSVLMSSGRIPVARSYVTRDDPVPVTEVSASA
jgi:hypothetical protein